MALAASGYTVDDLDWIRCQLGVAHAELDPWGNLIVTPASDLHVPDVMVFASGWRNRRDEHFSPPPLLVVEVASPSTRTVDRTRKIEDYTLGGAGAYLLVDVPGLAPVAAGTFELRRTGLSPSLAEGRIELDLASQPATLDLRDLRLD